MSTHHGKRVFIDRTEFVAVKISETDMGRLCNKCVFDVGPMEEYCNSITYGTECVNDKKDFIWLAPVDALVHVLEQ